MTFTELFSAAAEWAGASNETARAKDAVVAAVQTLSYGDGQPPMRPWWRKREDTITPVAGTQAYDLPTAQGTFESLHKVWYRTNGTRFEIDLVDDIVWHRETNEETTNRGTPRICQLHNSSGTIQLRFSPIPHGSFITTIDDGLIRMDGFILDPLTTASADGATVLMPESRHWGIVWKAVELLAARQGDTALIVWAAAQGAKYYQMILADDIYRTGNKQRRLRPMETMQTGSRRRPIDYMIPG